MAEFNKKMQEFTNKTRAIGLRFYMWPYWFKYQNKRFRESYWPAYKKSKSKKSILRIFFELIWISLIWRCLPYHYFRYKLYKKDFKKKDILKFIPETVIYSRVFPKINQNNFLLDNKIMFERVLRGSGINYPKTLFKIEGGNIFNEKDDVIESQEKINEIIMYSSSKKIFIKPANCGSGGKEILVFHKKGGEFLESKKRKLNFSYIKSISNNGDYIIQEGLENERNLREIHPSSLNSFRVITYMNKKPKVIYAILKAGNNNAETDNAHTGGVYVGVDLKNNKLKEKCFDEDLNEFDVHPTTNFDFKGIKIEGFEKVIEAAKKVATLFPTLKFVGWDIALTDKGAFVLEGNSSPGLTIIQRTNNGMRDFYNMIK